MAIRPIVILPDPVLRRKAEPVAAVDADIRQLMDDMLETMYDAPGIGLAAPQIGVSSRVIVMDCSEDEDTPAPLKMANPKLSGKVKKRISLRKAAFRFPAIAVMSPGRWRLSSLIWMKTVPRNSCGQGAAGRMYPA